MAGNAGGEAGHARGAEARRPRCANARYKPSEVRGWVRGQGALEGANKREYWTQIPESEYLAWQEMGMRGLLSHVQKLAEAAGAEDHDEMGRQLAIVEREIACHRDAFDELQERYR